MCTFEMASELDRVLFQGDHLHGSLGRLKAEKLSFDELQESIKKLCREDDNLQFDIKNSLHTYFWHMLWLIIFFHCCVVLMIFILSTTRSNKMVTYFVSCFVHIVEFMFSGFVQYEHCIIITTFSLHFL